MTDFDCIISLTSWTGRINNPDVCKVLYSIIRQKTKYKFKIVFTLSELEFPNHELPELMQDIIDAANIEVIWTSDNLKAYKKYYYVHEKYPDAIIITTDDDMMLSDDAIEKMMDFYQQHKNCICAQHIHKFDGDYVAGWFRLYPPNSLLDLPKEFFEFSFNSIEDDNYNAVLATLKGTKSIQTPFKVAFELDGNIQNCAFRHVYQKTNAKQAKSRLLKAIDAAKKQGITYK